MAPARRTIKDSTVLVTGAGGSIGSEIGRQLRCLGAGNIIYVDNNEYNLYLLERELHGTAALVDDTLVLADVQNLTALRDVFRPTDHSWSFMPRRSSTCRCSALARDGHPDQRARDLQRRDREPCVRRGSIRERLHRQGAD